MRVDFFNKNHRRAAIVIMTVVIVCWLVRFFTLNIHYRQYVPEVETVAFGEETAFGDNYISLNGKAQGCTIAAVGGEKADFRDVLKTYQLQADQTQGLPEHVLFIVVRLYNASARDCSVDISEFSLEGETWSLGLDSSLTETVNQTNPSFSDSGTDVLVKAGSYAQVTLAYSVYQDSMKEPTWNNLSRQNIFLSVTQRPVIKKLKIHIDTKRGAGKSPLLFSYPCIVCF